VRALKTRHPLFILGIIFCCGIIFSAKLRPAFPLLFIFSLFTFLLAWLSRNNDYLHGLAVASTVFLLSGALFSLHATRPSCHIDNFVLPESNFVLIEGFIDEEPFIRQGRTFFVFRARYLYTPGHKTKSCGRVMVRLEGGNAFRYGEELVLGGYLNRFFRTKNASYHNYLLRQGITARLDVPTPKAVTRTGINKGLALRRLSLYLKDRSERVICAYLSPVASGVVSAMVLGERRGVADVIENMMVKSGTVHILVVSGFNVGVVSFLLYLSLKILRIPARVRFYIAVLILSVYALITGGSNPVVRAVLMSAVYMFSCQQKREPDFYNASSLAAIFILAQNPQQLFDLGFQLSFLSVLCILFFYPRLKALFRLDKARPAVIRVIAESGLVSLSAWLGTLWPVALNFGLFSPVTVLANIFIAWLAVFITLAGFCLLLAGFSLPHLAILFSAPLEFSISLLLKINAYLVNLPFSYFYL